MTESPADPSPADPAEDDDWTDTAARWTLKGLGGIRLLLVIVLVTAGALTLSISVLLAVVIRDVPEPSQMAEDLVAEVALGIGVAPAEVDEIAREAVVTIDRSLMDGAIQTTDDVRLAVRVLPFVLAAVVLLGVWLARSGRRIGWLAWGLVVFGAGLALQVWGLYRSAEEAADTASLQAEATADRVVRGLIGPAWPIGVAALALGIVGLITLAIRSRADRTAPSGTG